MVKVLVVDDDAVSRLVLEHVLVNMGLEVETGGSVEEAIAALSQSLFDLIVCDHQMPGRTGLDLVDELAACSTPFVLLVDETDRAALTDDRLSAVAACLAKPVPADAVRDMLDAVLRSTVD